MAYFVNHQNYPVLIPRLGSRGYVSLDPGQAVEGDEYSQLATGRNPVLAGPVEELVSGVKVVYSTAEAPSHAAVVPPNPPRFGLVMHHGPTAFAAPLSDTPTRAIGTSSIPEVSVIQIAEDEAAEPQATILPAPEAVAESPAGEGVGSEPPPGGGWTRTKLRGLRAEQVREVAEKVAAERGVALPEAANKEALIDFVLE